MNLYIQGAIIGTLLTAVIGMWITSGQNFSTTLKPTPELPPGPTDKCFDVPTLGNATFNITDTPLDLTSSWTDFYSNYMETTTESVATSYQRP